MIITIIIILRLKISTQKTTNKQTLKKTHMLKLWEPSTNQAPYYTILIKKMLIF
jgi:hypothetical protein